MMISEKIKKLRQQRGLSQDSLAASINKTRAVVSHWERGITPVTVDDCVLLAEFFNIPVEDLVSNNVVPDSLDEALNNAAKSFFTDKTKSREELDEMLRSILDIYMNATKNK